MIAKAALALTVFSVVLTDAPVRAQHAVAPARKAGDDAQLLQGSWTGTGDYGDEKSAASVTVTVSGQKLHFQGLKTNDWYDATFTLPAGTRPAQLHAVITASPDKGSIGNKVYAIFRFEAGVLTLAEVEAGAIENENSEGLDKPSFGFANGTLDQLQTKPADRWKALEPSLRFRAKLRKLESPTVGK